MYVKEVGLTGRSRKSRVEVEAQVTLWKGLRDVDGGRVGKRTTWYPNNRPDYESDPTLLPSPSFSLDYSTFRDANRKV